MICNYDGVDDMGTGQVRHFRGCEIPDQLLSLWKGLCFSLLGFTKMQIAGSQEIKGSHYLARKVLKLTVSRCSHQDINGTEPESWPKKLKTIQVSPFRNINNFIAQDALSWDPKDQPFANISAQRCNDTILQVTIEVSIQRRRCNE